MSNQSNHQKSTKELLSIMQKEEAKRVLASFQTQLTKMQRQINELTAKVKAVQLARKQRKAMGTLYKRLLSPSPTRQTTQRTKK